MRKRQYTALSDCGAVGCDSADDALGSAAKRAATRSVAGGDGGGVSADAPLALVHNIVATTQIVATTMPINLEIVSRLLPNSYYDRQKFAAITIRMHDPTCTALLFTSGKLVLTGCRGWYECVLASMHIVRILKRYVDGVDFRVVNNTIQNIVGHVEVPLPEGGKLDLDRLYDTHCTHCTYQRNMFPGLIFRPDRSPIVLLCFFSGRIVITGGKSVRDITVGWKRLWPVIRNFIH